MPDNEEILAAIEELRTELRTVRRGQLNLTRTVVAMRHELNHRLGTSREDVGALVKASHAELTERFERLDTALDIQHQRLSELEADLVEILGDGRG